MKPSINAEKRRLEAHKKRKANWMEWGPYLAERAWGTVREDYSQDGNAWQYFPHEHARSRAYRWNEDGLSGICDRNQYLCFSLGLWNGQDAFLKERLFGLTGPEGNHGEDVKEMYWYCDSTPTYSYAHMCYRYPQKAFPYQQLLTENSTRGFQDREFELTDTGMFEGNQYFDIHTEYAKASPTDLLIRITVNNRSKQAASCSLIPQIWFRNTWSWGTSKNHEDYVAKPAIERSSDQSLRLLHDVLGEYHLYWKGQADLMVTDNETNNEKIFNSSNTTPWVKDAFHRYIVNNETDVINPNHTGTKAGLHYKLKIGGLSSKSILLRLSKSKNAKPFVGFKPAFDRRKREADNFYHKIQATTISEEERLIQRQALAGMLWSKQFYHYNVRQWLNGDPGETIQRKHPRNNTWQHLNNFDVMSMPDKWEYPWYAVWDTAFHCLPLSVVDPEYAKRQLLVITKEWFMHPNGQLPAYEWAFGDVNPPVHAWSAYSVYLMDKRQTGIADNAFLEKIFQKLLLNFTWWVNKKDQDGQSLFEGGFLGLDNISIFDRSKQPPMGGILKQSDGTAWMGFYAACMLKIALELARTNASYQDIASKFFEHYLQIAAAINGNGKSPGLWDPIDGFYYDRLDLPNGTTETIKVRSLVGLLPMIAMITLEDETYHQHPAFVRRMQRHLKYTPHHAQSITDLETSGEGNRHLLSFLSREKLTQLLRYLFDENEFLSDYGIRSLSRIHKDHPYQYTTKQGREYKIAYEAGEGETDLFGGNSNWRGPIWFPMNYLIIEALKKYHHFFGDDYKVEYPTHSGHYHTLDEVAEALSQRLIKLFTTDAEGQRPWCGTDSELISSSREGLHLFYEYFDGDTGRGLGASHQTGWTGLVSLLIQPELQCI